MANNGEKQNVVVLGAGVIGLTTALLLSQDPSISVTIVAKHMPGDYDIEYASPWAGANYLPVAKAGTPSEQYERNTWPDLARLATHHPEAGIHYQPTICHHRSKDAATPVGQWTSEKTRPDPWFASVVPDFRILPATSLPPGIDSASAFTSVCINTALYLPWLASQALANGAVLRRAIVAHIADAAALHHFSENAAAVVVNCTGLASRSLPGVDDANVYPVRGQIVLVRNEPGVMCDVSGCDDGPDELTYVMQRAAGGGTVLGGCYQVGAWEGKVDEALAGRIMRRAVELCPALTGGKGVEALSVVRHGVGLRPGREGGPRVEREVVRGVQVVHQYGHGGAGYQASYGSAKAAVELVREALAERRA